MNQFKWLAFISSDKTEGYDLTVPYDCEFIVIQPQNGNVYKLTEIYKIGKSAFHSLFGLWRSNAFDFKEHSIFQRRINLNDSVTVYALVVSALSISFKKI